MQVEYFFDCSSPWTYLSYTRIESICADHQAELIWKPFLVGGVFNAINQSVYEQRANPVPAKARYYQKDLQDWAKLHGITIGNPPVFPVNSVKVMRGCFVAEEAGCLPGYAGKVFAAYWSELQDISLDEVIVPIVESCGMDVTDFFGKISQDDYKQRLRDNTDELIRRGGFGSPTMFVGGEDMYFGNDRLILLENRLATGS